MGLISYALDHNHSEEIRYRFNYDEADDRIIISKTQDVERLLRKNQAMRLAGDGYTKDRTMRRVGSIPMIEIERIITEEGWDPMAQENADRLLQLLDDPDYSKFRTSDGKVSKRPRRHYLRGSASTKLVFGGSDDS